MASIEVLAERERRAEAGKDKASDTWRAAWWATTLALGAIPENEKKQIGEAQAIVRETMGQTSRWVQERTHTGRVFAALETGEMPPPRMAVEVVRSGIPVSRAIINKMIKAEKDGVGLREFTAELTGKGWSDTPSGASETTIKQIVKAQPEVVAKVVAQDKKAATVTRQELAPRTPKERVSHVREAIADLSEDEGVALARDHQTRVKVDRAVMKVIQEGSQQRKLNQTPVQNRIDDFRNWEITMAHGYTATSELRKMLLDLRDRGRLTKDQISAVDDRIETIRGICDLMESLGTSPRNSDAAFERELAELLNEERD